MVVIDGGQTDATSSGQWVIGDCRFGVVWVLGKTVENVFGDAKWVRARRLARSGSQTPTPNLVDAAQQIFRGLIFSGWIDGKDTKGPGNLDGDSVAVIPVRIRATT